MYKSIISATTLGVDSYPVKVEVDMSMGIMNFDIVGLPDTSVKESRQRVITALKNCGFKLPNRKITINLAPADLRKEGTLFDVPIAAGILAAAGLVELEADSLENTLFVGELSLNGDVRPVRGVLPIACNAQQMGISRVVIPLENKREVSKIESLEIIGVKNLKDLCNHLRGNLVDEEPPESVQKKAEKGNPSFDFAEVVGQKSAKRVLEIAAAGRHNVIFVGPPGSGKTMLAKRISTILPDMTLPEIIETSKIYSVAGKLPNNQLLEQRPFRCPHHTISEAGLVGGGSTPQPGEISLAHNGILFLDELTEFRRSTLETLRQVVETGTVSISRARYSVTFPSSFLLVAAFNPCPCGYWGSQIRECRCTPQKRVQYLERLSGPLLDRIDLQVAVKAVKYKDTKNKTPDLRYSSEKMKFRVNEAIEIQRKRFGSLNRSNALMAPGEIHKYCSVDKAVDALVSQAFANLGLSMRGLHKLLKVARTIADLDGKERIEETHIKEATMYRSLDRNLAESK